MPTRKIYKENSVALPINWQKAQHIVFVLLLSAVVYFLMMGGAYADDANPLSGLLPPGESVTPPGATDGSLFVKISDILFGNLPPMEQVLCSILFLIVGDVGRGVSTLAVMSMGIGAMMGKVSWGQALTVASGIGIMFGAPIILPLLLFDPVEIVKSGFDFSSFNIPCVEVSL